MLEEKTVQAAPFLCMELLNTVCTWVTWELSICRHCVAGIHAIHLLEPAI